MPQLGPYSGIFTIFFIRFWIIRIFFSSLFLEYFLPFININDRGGEGSGSKLISVFN